MTTYHTDLIIAAASVKVADFPLCELRLQNDARYPWFILLPRKAGLTELYELSSADQNQLMVEISAVSRYVAEQGHFKINVASLGNVVPQLHIHVIGRNQNDEAWPQPVFGKGTAVPYEDGKLEAVVDDARRQILIKQTVN
jgi:diadenosine tetraphosphate (Ap4A) HIT family hydrolase